MRQRIKSEQLRLYFKVKSKNSFWGPLQSRHSFCKWVAVPNVVGSSLCGKTSIEKKIILELWWGKDREFQERVGKHISLFCTLYGCLDVSQHPMHDESSQVCKAHTRKQRYLVNIMLVGHISPNWL